MTRNVTKNRLTALILVLMTMIIFTVIFWSKMYRNNAEVFAITDFDRQPINDILIFTGNTKYQDVINFSNHTIMRLKVLNNQDYSMVAKDIHGNYWLITLARITDRKPRLYIFDNEGRNIHYEMLFLRLPTCIRSYEDYILKC